MAGDNCGSGQAGVGYLLRTLVTTYELLKEVGQIDTSRTFQVSREQFLVAAWGPLVLES